MSNFTEEDMYPPVKNYFESLGYVIQGEVNGIDAVALKDDEILLLEFKKSFNIKLLYQAMDRQKISPNVYVVIPRPKISKGGNFTKIKQIVSRLGFGLITVAMDSKLKSVEVLIEPESIKNIKTNQRKKDGILKEMDGRNLNVNSGGASKKKILTAFRERSIKVACIMYINGPASAAELVKLHGCEKDAYAIINRNFYGWFKKIDKGIYDLSDVGIAEIKNTEGQFKEAFDFYIKECTSTESLNNDMEELNGSKSI